MVPAPWQSQSVLSPSYAVLLHASLYFILSCSHQAANLLCDVISNDKMASSCIGRKVMQVLERSRSPGSVPLGIMFSLEIGTATLSEVLCECPGPY